MHSKPILVTIVSQLTRTIFVNIVHREHRTGTPVCTFCENHTGLSSAPRLAVCFRQVVRPSVTSCGLPSRQAAHSVIRPDNSPPCHHLRRLPQGSDPGAATCRGKLQFRRSRLNVDINKHLLLRQGAENLLRSAHDGTGAG